MKSRSLSTSLTIDDVGYLEWSCKIAINNTNQNAEKPNIHVPVAGMSSCGYSVISSVSGLTLTSNVIPVYHIQTNHHNLSTRE